MSRNGYPLWERQLCPFDRRKPPGRKPPRMRIAADHHLAATDPISDIRALGILLQKRTMVLLFDSGVAHAAPLRWESKYHTGRVMNPAIVRAKAKGGIADNARTGRVA